MNLSIILISNILPLYALIGLGYIAGRWLQVHLQSLARILLFIISPIVIFGAMVQMDFNPAYVLLPFYMLCASLLISSIFYRRGIIAWGSNVANLIGLGSLSGNTGYFGLPLVLAVYGTEWAVIYLFINVSITISENTLGYFLVARGRHTLQESLTKVLRLPGLHALWIGLLVNTTGWQMPELLNRYWAYATGTWVFLGMMVIGVALAGTPRLIVDFRLMRWLFSAKFIIWPLAGLALIGLDQFVLHFFTAEIHGLILVFTTVPLMGNLVAYAAQMNLYPERAATAVLLSTVFALVYMPCVFYAVRFFGLIP